MFSAFIDTGAVGNFINQNLAQDFKELQIYHTCSGLRRLISSEESHQSSRYTTRTSHMRITSDTWLGGLALLARWILSWGEKLGLSSGCSRPHPYQIIPWLPPQPLTVHLHLCHLTDALTQIRASEKCFAVSIKIPPHAGSVGQGLRVYTRQGFCKMIIKC